jgi:1-phosphatidylinositol phosphodiesterase
MFLIHMRLIFRLGDLGQRKATHLGSNRSLRSPRIPTSAFLPPNQEKYKVSRYASLRSYPFFPAILTIQTTHSTSNMAPSLTIRNLTSTPLELKLIERYEAPSSNERKRNATSSAPSAPKLGEHAQSFSQQDADIRIEPFKIHTTDIKATKHLGNETIRLTIESDGQRYRIDIPSRKTESQTFTPLVPDPRRQFTGVFLPNDAYLSIYPSANLPCWMKELKDETPLSALSIPGTHNSPTYYKALPSVRCQAVSPKSQLENGIRFFDIRVQPQSPTDLSKDGLILVHGVFPISLTGTKYLRDLTNPTLDFLARNPSETLIMSLKREGAGNATDQQLSQILHKHYATDSAKWFTEPRIPTLGEARGKIVLLRRFRLDESLQDLHDGRGWCLNAENWAYNTPNDAHGDVCVQDFCEVLEAPKIAQKIEFSQAHLAAAGSCVAPLPGVNTDAVNPVPPGPLYLNFLSASNFWRMGCWPERIAARLNPAVTGYLCTKHHLDGDGDGDGGTGIVVCDWVGLNGDWDLVRCIIGMNSKLEMREKFYGERGLT